MLPQFPRIHAHSVEPEFPISTSFVMFAQGYDSNTISIILSYSRLKRISSLHIRLQSRSKNSSRGQLFRIRGISRGKTFERYIPNPKIPVRDRISFFLSASFEPTKQW